MAHLSTHEKRDHSAAQFVLLQMHMHSCSVRKRSLALCRGQHKALRKNRQGEVLRHFKDFGEKFWSKFWISLYVLYIFTSPSAQNREKSVNLGRLFLPIRPLGWAQSLSEVSSSFLYCMSERRRLWRDCAGLPEILLFAHVIISSFNFFSLNYLFVIVLDKTLDFHRVHLAMKWSKRRLALNRADQQ